MIRPFHRHSNLPPLPFATRSRKLDTFTIGMSLNVFIRSRSSNAGTIFELIPQPSGNSSNVLWSMRLPRPARRLQEDEKFQVHA